MVPHPFLVISLFFLESDPSNMAPTPRKNPTAAEQNPAEEAQVELSMHVPAIMVYYIDRTTA